MRVCMAMRQSFGARRAPVSLLERAEPPRTRSTSSTAVIVIQNVYPPVLLARILDLVPYVYYMYMYMYIYTTGSSRYSSTSYLYTRRYTVPTIIKVARYLARYRYSCTGKNNPTRWSDNAYCMGDLRKSAVTNAGQILPGTL